MDSSSCFHHLCKTSKFCRLVLNMFSGIDKCKGKALRTNAYIIAAQKLCSNYYDDKKIDQQINFQGGSIKYVLCP